MIIRSSGSLEKKETIGESPYLLPSSSGYKKWNNKRANLSFVHSLKERESGEEETKWGKTEFRESTA